MCSHPIKLGLGLTLMVALGVVCVGSSRAFAEGVKEFTADDFKKVTKDLPTAKLTELLGKPKESVEIPAPLEMQAHFYASKGGYYVVATKDGKVYATETFKNKDEFDKNIEIAKTLAKSAMTK